MNDRFTEIERKFLLKAFPDGLPLKRQLHAYQAYLSTDPEVRIRRSNIGGNDVAHYITVKSNGELVRREVEMPISGDDFYALADMVPYPFIKKEFRVYELPNGLELECSLVDAGLSTEFMYGEVEFPSEEDAENFVPCFDHVGEITHCTDYRMKNYWKRTRLERTVRC